MNIVNEHIDEAFIKGDNKLKNLGIGMLPAIIKWLADEDISNYTIRDDFTIDSVHTVTLIHKIDKLPSFIHFGTVRSFNCSGCDMISLKGCPEYIISSGVISGNFNCSWNNLKTLDYGPKKVEGSFKCEGNYLSDQEINNYVKHAHVTGHITWSFQKEFESFTRDKNK